MPKLPSYVRVEVQKSFCSNCSLPVTLLQHISSAAKPQFYICWNCQKIYEIGKGEVKG